MLFVLLMLFTLFHITVHARLAKTHKIAEQALQSLEYSFNPGPSCFYYITAGTQMSPHLWRIKNIAWRISIGCLSFGPCTLKMWPFSSYLDNIIEWKPQNTDFLTRQCTSGLTTKCYCVNVLPPLPLFQLNTPRHFFVLKSNKTTMTHKLEKTWIL